MDTITLNGRGVTSGIIEGEVLVIGDVFGFAHGVEPTTGRVLDEMYNSLDRNVRNKVLLFSYWKWSVSEGLYILETVKRDNAPAAIITLEIGADITVCFIMAKLLYDKEIPIIDRLDRNPVDIINTGDWVKVDANNGIIEIFH